MELYEFSKDRKKILVYELQGIKERIKKYKIEQIDIGEIYTLETFNKELVDMILRGDTIKKELLVSKNGYLYTDLISNGVRPLTYYERAVKENVMRKYYNGECLNFNIVQVDTGNKVRDLFSQYFLLPLAKYEHIYSYRDNVICYRFSNILHLRNDLAGLQYLEQGNFDKLLTCPNICSKTPFELFELDLKMSLPNELGNDAIADILGFDNEEYISKSSKIITLYRNSIKK